MRIGHFACLFAALAAAVHVASAAQSCRIERSAPLPVVMQNGHAVATVQINGTPARFIVDTGSPYTTLTPAAANRLALPITTGPYGMYLAGVGGGSATTFLATVKTFTVFGYPVHNLRLLVAGNDFPGGVVGLLGENVLRLTDFEYSFANGVVRMVVPQHCGDRPLAYWAAGQPVSVVNIEPASQTHGTDWIIGNVSIDGTQLRALFDTGAPYSIIAQSAAGRLGLTPSSPGVRPAGFIAGVAGGTSRVWTAPIRRIRIGSESIEHTRMFFGRIELRHIDVILGADFFLSHHVYVANSQGKMYLTYNGGPVFDLQPAQLSRTTATGARPVTPSAAPTNRKGGAQAPLPTSVSASQLMRRGMAAAARHQYPQAIADLTHACQLAPKDAEYFYRRGTVYRADQQYARALADFTRAIELNGDDYRAHLARAELRVERTGLQEGNQALIRADLALTDQAAPPEAELRLPLAWLYDRIGAYRLAIGEYDRWITYHLNDFRLPLAWSGRCLARAQLGHQLHRAQRDCDRALAQAPHLALAHLGRTLLDLRADAPRAAVADATSSIHEYRQARRQRATPIRPALLAVALYARALGEQQLGQRQRSAADRRAARTLDANLGTQFAHWGISTGATHGH